MTNNLKIKLSISAYDKLIAIVNEDIDYNSIRFKLSNKCCGKPKLELMLDKLSDKGDYDIIDKVDQLYFIFDKTVKNTYKEIVVIYENCNFLLKAVQHNTDSLDCSNCRKSTASNCGECSSCNH